MELLGVGVLFVVLIFVMIGTEHFGLTNTFDVVKTVAAGVGGALLAMLRNARGTNTDK